MILKNIVKGSKIKLKEDKCNCFSHNLSNHDKDINNLVIMEINNKKTGIDKCISSLIKALNNANLMTIASCCGHNKIPGDIFLEDGRILAIFKSREHYEEYMPHFVKTDRLESKSKNELLEIITDKYKVYFSMDRVIKKLLKMKKENFKETIEEHKKGEIAKIILSLQRGWGTLKWIKSE